MLAPRWMHLALALLFASVLLPTSIFSFPIGTPNQISRPLALDSSLSRRAPQPAKRKRKSQSPVPHAQGSSGHQGSSSHHHTADPKTPSPDGSPRTGPLDVDPSPHASTRSKSVKKIREQATNLNTDALRSKNYRDETKERYDKLEEQAKKDGNKDHKKIDWNTHEADHLLELQTVTQKINKHKGSKTLTKKCVDSLKAPLNAQSNLKPLHKDVNANKKIVMTAIAMHDRFDSIKKQGSSTRQQAQKASKDTRTNQDEHPPELPKLDYFGKDAANHIHANRHAILKTAQQVDKAIADDCPELGETRLVKPGGRIHEQAKHIIAHATESIRIHNSHKSG